MDLYRLLLDPVLRRFSQSRLIISPDDVLTLLPFEAMKDSKSRFLVRSKIISYASSASGLHALRTAAVERFAQRPLLAVGDVNYASVRLPVSTPGQPLKQSILRGLKDLYWTQLPSLPESRDEVLSVAHASTPAASILMGSDATETAFKAHAADYRVIHMAVHAISDAEYPYRASLVLGADSQDDGLLQVREILRLRIRADLVSLSACETGVGTLQGEAGMTSLVQAFLTAGAKAVVGSLWGVEDRWAAELMKEFYRHLLHEDKAAALRDAKVALLDRYGDQAPDKWAGFTLWGEGSTRVSLRPN